MVDPDRGSGSVAAKQAEFMDTGHHADREETRAGARELDAMVEGAPGLSRQQRDRERAMPRPGGGQLGHPGMERQMPVPDSVRGPLSSRQRKARSVDKRAAQDRLPQTQYEALSRCVADRERWDRVNDGLSDRMGDAQELDEADRVQVQRIDRAIQSYERDNRRGHVVYANVEMPTMINWSNLAGFCRNHFSVGTEVAFDRFTGGRHTLHEVEIAGEEHRTAVFEIQTTRGMYLGRSDSVDDTSHLLPRGMRFRVLGSHTARYRRPDGTEGRRQVIQLADITDTPTSTPTDTEAGTAGGEDTR